MHFVKYKELLSKVVSQDGQISQILTQQPETFTHLFLITSSNKLEQINSSKVQVLKFEDYILKLYNSNYFDDISKVDIKTIMELILEEASKELIWIENLHEVEYSEEIRKILLNYLN